MRRGILVGTPYSIAMEMGAKLNAKYTGTIKALSFVFLLSTAFFTHGIFVGYDAPPVYTAAIGLVWLIALGRLYVPSRVAYGWGFILISFVLSGLFSEHIVAREKLLTQTARAMLGFSSFVIMYTISRLMGSRVTYRFMMLIAVSLSVLGVVQFLSANRWGYVIYFPPTNPSFAATGGPGAVAGSLRLYRATGTFPEPSWLASYLLMALVPTIGHYTCSGTLTSLVALLVILGGLISTASVIGVMGAIVGIVFAGLLTVVRCAVPARRLVVLLLLVTAAALGASLAVSGTGWGKYVMARLGSILSDTDPSGSMRMASIKHAVELFLESPMFGIGIGQYAELLDRVDVGVSSGWVTLLTETGLVGLAAWTWLVVVLLRTALSYYGRQKGSAVVVAWWIGLLAVFNWWYDQWYWSVLGIATAEAREAPMAWAQRDNPRPTSL